MRALILEISAMQFSQAARLRLFSIGQKRSVALNAMGLQDHLRVSAVSRIPRDGEYLFGEKLLESVDSDISMQKRAKEVVQKLSLPRRAADFRKPYSRPFTSFPSRARGAYSFRSRGRGFRRPARGRGGAGGRTPQGTPPSSGSNRS